MALTHQQKADIRRHLGYGNIGLSVNNAGGGSLGANASWRYFGEWGELEIRLDSLAPLDEASLTGYATGSLVLQGPDPEDGDALSIRLSGGLLTAPVTISKTVAGQKRADFGLSIAAACAQNPALAAARIVALMPYSGGRSGVINPLTEIGFVSPEPFLLEIVSQSGLIGASIFADGSVMPNPQASFNEQTYYGFLPICNALHGLCASVSDRLFMSKADVFVARPQERKERRALYYEWCNDMADFLVAQMNPERSAGRSSNLGSL